MILARKKILIIAVIVIILISVLIGFTQNTNHRQNITSNAVTTSNNTSKPSVVTSNSYNTSTYTVSYPKDWSQNEQELTNNSGNVLLLQPTNYDQQINPYVSIQTADANLLPLSTMTQGFKTFAYHESNQTVAGVPAQKYTALIATNEGFLHSTAYVFSANGKNYMIKMGYKQKDTNQEIENQYMQIVNNFKLN